MTAFEHHDIPVRPVGDLEAIDGVEADALEAVGLKLPGFCDRRHRSVRLAHFCGIARIGSRLLEVLPKVDERRGSSECRGVLLNLLQRSNQVSIFRHHPSPQLLRDGPLIEVFIAAFFDTVRDIVRGGLLQRYRNAQEDLRVLRGRVVGARQFSTFANRQDVIACDFDELTADNEWNRFVKAGLRAVKPWVVSFGLRRRLRELLFAFDEVTDVAVAADAFYQLPTDRKASRYRPAAEWARRALAMQSPSLRAGSDAASGLLFDVNKLWERAVVMELRRRAVDANIAVDEQVAGRYLANVEGSGRRAIGLRPDIVIARHGSIAAIADTKWKRINVTEGGYLKPSSEDLHQMHAYAAAFECNHLALIYPSHKELANARETTFELLPNASCRAKVSVVCVDIEDNRFDAVVGRSVLREAGFGF